MKTTLLDSLQVLPTLLLELTGVVGENKPSCRVMAVFGVQWPKKDF